MGGKLRSALPVIVTLVGIALVGAAAFLMVPDLLSANRYEDLKAGTTHIPDLVDESDSGIDWDELREQNGDVKAWVRIDNTNIDLPVCQADDNDTYLHTTFWGEYSNVGTPFMDYRVPSADGFQVTCYGHHMGSTSTAFSDIADCFEQDAFDGLGDVHWSTPDKGESVLHPIMAMNVHASYEPPQTFDAKSVNDVRQQLRGMLEDATATSEDCDARIESANRVVMLVCCSSRWSNQPWRAVLVCVS